MNDMRFLHPSGVIANVLVMKDFTTRWPIGAWEKGLMSTVYLHFCRLGSTQTFHVAAVLELGALFGALICGILADRFSRRHSIFVACGMSVSHTLCTKIHS